MLIDFLKNKDNFIRVFPLLLMFAIMQSVRKNLENIDLNNFWSTDITNATGINNCLVD